jgi:L-aspartate oxidase
MTYKYDFLVIGSGIAGMSFALKVADYGKVAIIAKNSLEDANTYYAQGGIASVTNPWDNFDKHIADTLDAGAGLCDVAVVEKVVREAPAQIKELIGWGVDFDKDEQGNFDLHKEGGHSEFRILHHKDNTGAEIQLRLINAIKNHPNIDVFDNHFAIEILTQHHLGKVITSETQGIECYGAYILDQKTNQIDTFLSRITMMATGGIGCIYQTTTNPLVATGDGIAMVSRAKGEIKGMEFVQFHPTALYHPGDRPSFLISEAVRGYGAILRTKDGIIWNLLSDKEKWDIKKIKKETGLSEKEIYAAIGWLARENKIEFEENEGNEYYYLIIEYYF